MKCPIARLKMFTVAIFMTTAGSLLLSYIPESSQKIGPIIRMLMRSSRSFLSRPHLVAISSQLMRNIDVRLVVRSWGALMHLLCFE